MILRHGPILFSLLIFLAGCSSLGERQKSQDAANSEKNQEGETAKESGEPQTMTSEDIQTRLNKLTESAESVGPHAVNYLATDLYLKASAASAHGDYATAVLLYNHLHKMLPDDNFLRQKLAVELIKIGQIAESQIHLETVHRADPKNSEIALLLGGVYVSLKKKKEAKKLYRSVLKKDPKNVDACLYLVKVYALETDYKRAIDRLSMCEKSTKAEGAYAFYKGRIYLEMNQVNNAKKQFRRALKLNPSYYQAALGLGLIEEERERYKQAATVYENYLKHDPDNEAILSRIVQIYFALENYGKVVGYAESLSYLDPGNLNLKVKLGILYSDSKMYEKAIEKFEQIIKEVPDSDKILYYLGAIYQETKRYEKAIQYFGKIPSDSPLYLDGSLQIAQTLQLLARQEGNKARVEDFYSFIDRKSESSEDLRIELGLLKASFQEDRGSLDEAISTVLSLDGHQKFSDDHRYYLASLYEKNKNFEKSIEIVEGILERNPENAHAMNFLGYSLLERGGDLDKAYSLIKRAVEIAPEDGYIRDSLGWYYYKTGEYEKALYHLKMANEAAGTDPVITKHLAMVYRDMKDYKKARKFYLSAIEKSHTQNEKDELRDEIQQIENILRSPASE